MDKSNIRLNRILNLNLGIYEATEYIWDSHCYPNDYGEDIDKEKDRPVSTLNIPGVEGEVWIGVRQEIGKSFVKQFFIPHIFVDERYYLELNLGSISDKDFDDGLNSLVEF